MRRELALFAPRHRFPMFASPREQAVAGALMSYGPSQPDQYRKAAGYVDRILRGAKPADLPVEQPTTLALVVIQRTADALGLDPPQSLLLRADEFLR
jgi:putative tryptophan/tyrosine transport system substrate-binding protein